MKNELTAAICAIMDQQQVRDGAYDAPVPGLRLVRSFERRPPQHMNCRPSLCFVAQGARQMLVGDTNLVYGAMQTLIVTCEMPAVGEIIEASGEAPFVGATLTLNISTLTEVATHLDPSIYAESKPGFGAVVENLDQQMSATLVRLVELMNRPKAIDVLYPSLMREISYWLLTGPAAPAVARIALPAGPTMRVVKAIQLMREAYAAPLSIDDLAKTAGMSPSTFHQHFKALTSMSPIQYQKQLRLLEARRRMLADGVKAGVAALGVGYESVSQFSREYARMFGEPPRRETSRAKTE
jgi:AraC-like DNA-binding protein